MLRTALNFERPAELQATTPPEARGLQRDEVRLMVSTPEGHAHTVFQRLDEHLRPGDLLASGTISGPTPDSYGSLLELSWGGERPLQLPTGETRRFLEDGDRLALAGWCEQGDYRVGFGEIAAEILPAGG